jgi:uncharacterized repeat protein (TIGR04052 family)
MKHIDPKSMMLAFLMMSSIALTPVSRASQGMQAVAIKFRAMVGQQPFTCGSSYEEIGVTHSKITPVDFRFFVHNIRLIDDKGNDVPVQLDQDGQWQADNLALLDFEDGTGPCSNGTTDIHDTVTGQVPAGSYRGIRFIVGVPFDKNHRDPTTQPSPLNISQMFWVWNVGYKFVRIDLRTTGLPRGFFVHLGSTGCTPNNTVLTIPTSCVNPNRPEVTLEDFDPEHSVIAADLKALLNDSNVDANQSGTSAGCESSPSDGDCAPLFHNLGLPFGGVPSTGQTFFRTEPVPHEG